MIVANADGTTIQRRFQTAKKYLQIAEREGYFVALSNEPNSLDILDKQTLKLTKHIRLPFAGVTSLAVHPFKKISYVGIEQVVEGKPRYPVVIVDEASGDVRESDNLIGRYLAIDPSGQRLYCGYKDIYQRGVELFMNPDGQIWDTPDYGVIDLLMEYDLELPTRPQLIRFKDKPGANGFGIRLSPDGNRITYLSFSGYPQDSHCVPAWDPTDFGKLPVTFECAGKAAGTKMSYHPTLPLVIVPGNSGPIFFNRETGEEESDRLTFTPSALGSATLDDAFFSPDGMSAILQLNRAGKFSLYKAPLKLSAAEREKAQQGPPVSEPPAPTKSPAKGLSGARA